MEKSSGKIHVKNMVCNRCIKVVKEELEKAGLTVNRIKLGEVEVSSDTDELNFKLIRKVLEENGFELIEDRKARLIEKVKVTVIGLIYDDGAMSDNKTNFSRIISESVALDYNYISTLFSSVENITIEQYIILQKIERVKELLKYDELTLSEIAYKLGYSSVAHLSAQFKKVTGMNASEFRNMTGNIRKPIDKIGL